MPKKIVNAIVGGKNHYVLAVKGNQGKLRAEVEQIAAEQNPLDIHIGEKKSNGYNNEWVVAVFDGENSPFTKDWKNMKSVILVRKISERISTGEKTESHRYYISDMDRSGIFFHNGIKGHWGVENCVHWVKDVLFGEDDNRLEMPQSATNASVFSTIVLNIHRSINPEEKILDSQMKFCAAPQIILNKLRT